MRGMFKRQKSLMLFNLEPDQYSYKGLLLFLAVYIGATIFAAFATAPAYWFVEWVHSVSPSDTTTWLLGKKMDVYFDRMRWIPIIIFLPWVLAKCGLFSIKNLGIRFNAQSLFSAGKFFLFGIVLAGAIFSMQIMFADSSLKAGLDFSTVLKAMSTAILGAVILSFLEEIVFRGLIMRTIYTASTPLTAVILSSLFFAYKHFKVPDSAWANIPGGLRCTDWDIGFFVAYYDAIGISENFALVPFCSLAMFGMLLCAVYIKTKNLLIPISLHAGLVFMIQLYRSCFDIEKCEASRYFGTAGMTNGLMPLIILTALFAWFAFAPGKKSEDS